MYKEVVLNLCIMFSNELIVQRNKFYDCNLSVKNKF